MADEEKKLNSSFKDDDDNENNSSPASTEIPMDDTPSKLIVKMPMKTEDQKNYSAGSNVDDIVAKVKISMLNDDQNSSSSTSEKPTDDIPAKVKSELSKLLNDDDEKNISSSSSSEMPILDDTPSKVKLIPSDSDANEGKPIEMDVIPLKVKMEAEAKKSEIVMPRYLPFKTEYPRAYGYGHLLPTEPQLKPDRVESSSEKVKLIPSDGANSDANEEKPIEMDDILLKMRMAAEAKISQIKTRSYGYGNLSPTIVPEPGMKPGIGVFPEADHVESSSKKVNGANSDANEEKPIEMPLKGKMEAEAKKSEIEMPRHHQLPFKTEYPRAYGYGHLSPTIVPDPRRLKPVLGVPHVFPEADDHVESSSEKPDHVESSSKKADHVESGSEKADDEDDGGNVSGG